MFQLVEIYPTGKALPNMYVDIEDIKAKSASGNDAKKSWI